MCFLCFQSDDYISLRVNVQQQVSFDETIGALLMDGRVPVAIPVLDDLQDGQDATKVLTEAQLPPYPTNVTLVDGAWQPVGNTR